MSDAIDGDAAEILGRLIAARYSCRGFREQRVPDATIDRLLAMAAKSPSWCNTQPWRVFVTSGVATEQLRSGLLDWVATNGVQPDIPFPERYEGDALARRRECGWQLYEAVGVERGDRVASMREAARNFELFGAPHLAVITSDRLLGTYGAVDCGIYVANFLLAAQSLGVATIAQAAIAGCAPYLHDHFGLGPERQVICGISFGYEDPEHPANGFRTHRAPLSATVERVGDSDG